MKLPILGIIRLAVQRLFSQIGLNACLALGIAMAVMLSASIPAFSDAVQLRVLQTRVETNSENTRRPPFAFMYAYFGSISGQIEYEDYQKDDSYILSQFPSTLQLPITRTVRYVHTPKFRLFPAVSSAQYLQSNRQLEWVDLGFVSDFDSHVQVFGEKPKLRNDGVIETLAYSELANELGLQAGEEYVLYGAPKRGEEPVQLRLKITGVWVEKSLDIGVLFPFFAVPAGIIFLMMDDRRKAEVGRVTLVWGIIGTIFHTLITAWLLKGAVDQVRAYVPFLNKGGGAGGAGITLPNQSQPSLSSPAPQDAVRDLNFPAP